MAIQVELPGGEIAEFPDDMPQAQIHAAVKKHLAPAVTAEQAQAAGILPRSGLTPDIARKESQETSTQQVLARGGTVLKSQDQIDAERAQRWSEDLGEAAQDLNIAPKITVPLAKGVGAGAAGLVAPENVLWMAAPGAAGKVMGQAFKATMAGQAAKTAFEAGQDLQSGNTEEGLKKLGEAATTGGVLAIPHGTARVPETIRPREFTTPEALEPLAEKARALTPKEQVIDIASQVLPEAGKAAKDVVDAADQAQKDAIDSGDEEHPALKTIRELPPGRGKEAILAGADLDPERPQDLAALMKMREEADAARDEAMQKAKAETDPAKRTAAMFEVAPLSQRAADLREAVEAATGTGGSADKAKGWKPDYQAPFPEGKPRAAAKEGAPQPDWKVVVQPTEGEVPGFVQVIDPRQTEQSKSPTVESLKAAGHEVPDFSKLPKGSYTYEQATKLLAEQAKPKEVISDGKDTKEEKGDERLLTTGAEGVQPSALPNARVVSPRPIKEPYSDKHSISIQVANTGTEGFSNDAIKQSLPESLRGDLEAVRRMQGEVVPTNPKLSVPGRIELVFKDKAAAQKALEHFKGAEKAVSETPAKVEAKVDRAVKKAAVTGTLSPKEVKDELVSRVQKELEDAPDEDEYLSKATVTVKTGQNVNGSPIMSEVPVSEIKNATNKSGDRIHTKLVAAALKEHAPQVTIDIPGDGTFTIYKTKQALNAVLERAKKLDTSGSKPVAVKKSGIPKADRDWISEQIGQRQEPINAGPGAATRPGAVLQTDIGAMETNIPPLEKLADAVAKFPKQAGASFKEKLKQWMDEVGLPTKDLFGRAITGAKAATAKVVSAIRELPVVTSMDRAIGRWNLEDTEGDLAARRFSNAIKERFPDRSKLRALSNYINAGGDKDLLKRQADLTKDQALKKTYEDALKFGPEEEKLAREVRQYHDEMLATAMETGALEEGLENYIHRYYPRENDPARKKLESALNTYRFTKNFAGFKRRFYDSDFEAEQAGLKPEKDAAKRILAYDQGFRKALTARAFVKDRYAAKMEDGRPEIDVVGAGVPSAGDLEAGKKGAYLIKPKSKAGGDSPEDYRGDYISFDHPAFRKWKWVGQDANGKPILMEGEMAVHPDAVKKYKALFERSWFQKNPVGRALLMPSNFVKQTMLAISAFHPVQIGIHAIEHKVNPFKLTDLNTRDPAQAKLIEGGLVVSDLGGAHDFSEGVSGSGLIGKIPLAGEMVKTSQDWLFKDFIPRIKMTMALDALERNRKTYAKDVASGKITDEQLVRLTARESNAAFGEQNYRAMFRHKGFQDFLRFVFLAPDFGEARLRFPLQAATVYGREQQMALVLGAFGMATIAKSLEYGMTGQVNWNRPFTVTYKDREYGLRNVASDLYHMVTDPAGYLRNRLNPIYTRAALEMLSGRDAFGRKRTGGQQVADELKQIVPISARGLVEKDQKMWESFINAIGLTEHRKSAFSDEMKDINKWKEKKGYTTPGEFVYDADKDPYSKLTSTLTYGSVKDARKELDKLVDGKTPAEARKVAEHYRRSLKEHQFLTSSRAHEAEYVKALDASGKERYADAKKERQAMWAKFVQAYRSKYPPK